MITEKNGRQSSRKLQLLKTQRNAQRLKYLSRRLQIWTEKHADILLHLRKMSKDMLVNKTSVDRCKK